MAEKKQAEKSKEKAEQLLAREQRKELRDELTENFAQRPRLPAQRRRVITFSVMGSVALLTILFTTLVLWPTSAQQPHGGIAVGAQAPGFTLPIAGGVGKGTINLRALRGHPVVINFWSESCPPCLSEVPYLRGIYAQYGQADNFILLGIDQADPRGDIATFGQNFKVNYPLLFDPGSSTNINYGVTSLPMTYFLDSQGIVRFVAVQELTPQTMQQGLAAVGITIP